MGGTTYQLLHGLSHSVLSNHLVVGGGFLLPHSSDEKTEAREVMRLKVTIGPLCMLVDCLDCELCDSSKWLGFSKS